MHVPLRPLRTHAGGRPSKTTCVSTWRAMQRMQLYVCNPFENVGRGVRRSGRTLSCGSTRITGCVRILDATEAKCSVARVCSACDAHGDRHASMVVVAALSRPSASRRVSIESRNGTCKHDT